MGAGPGSPSDSESTPPTSRPPPPLARVGRDAAAAASHRSGRLGQGTGTAAGDDAPRRVRIAAPARVAADAGPGGGAGTGTGTASEAAQRVGVMPTCLHPHAVSRLRSHSISTLHHSILACLTIP